MPELKDLIRQDILRQQMAADLGVSIAEITPQIDTSGMAPMASHMPLPKVAEPIPGVKVIKEPDKQWARFELARLPSGGSPYGGIDPLRALTSGAVNLPIGLAEMTLNMPAFLEELFRKPKMIPKLPEQIVDPAAKLAAAINVEGESPQASKFAQETINRAMEHPEEPALPILTAAGIAKPLAKLSAKITPGLRGVEAPVGFPDIEAKNNVTYNGLQETPKGPPLQTFTDNKTGSTFLVESLDEVPARVAEVRKSFEKPPAKTDIGTKSEQLPEASAPKVEAKPEPVSQIENKPTQIENTPSSAGKQPWEMTRGEFVNDYIEKATKDIPPEKMTMGYTGDIRESIDINATRFHKESVEQAAQEGKFGAGVNDYPDLVAKYGEEAPVAETPKAAVQEIVEGKRESKIGNAEFKKRMIAELDKAIENHPDYEDYRQAIQAVGEKEAAKMTFKDFDNPKIEIHIPGDGDFVLNNDITILNNVKDAVFKIKDIEKPPAYKFNYSRNKSALEKAKKAGIVTYGKVGEKIPEPKPLTDETAYEAGLTSKPASLGDVWEPEPKSWTPTFKKSPKSKLSSESGQLPTLEGGYEGMPDIGENLMPKPKVRTKQELIKRSNIVKKLSEQLDVPIRSGRARFNIFGKKYLGFYKTHAEAIRIKTPKDLPTIGHEVGHHLFKELGLMDDIAAFKPNRAFQSYKGLGKELYVLGRKLYKSATGEKALNEGVAEFTRMYLTDPVQAKKICPDFYKHFEDKLTTDYPEIYDILQTARKDIERWNNQPATAKVLSDLSVGEKQRMGFSFNKLYTWLVDDSQPIKVAVDAVTNGKGIPELGKNPHKLAELYRGWSGRARTFVEHGVVDENYNKIGPGLKEILSPVSDRLDDCRAFVTAKRAMELAERKIKSGIDKDVARQVLIEAEDKGYTQEFTKVQKELVGFQDAVLQELVKADVISKETAASMRQLNQEYVPFFRVFDTETYKGFKTKGFGNLNQGVKRIKGSGRDIVDPFESIVKNTFTLINLAERNKVGLAVADLAKIEGSGAWVEKVEPPKTSITIELAEIQDQIIPELAKQGVEFPADFSYGLEGLNGVANVFRPSLFPPGKENILTVFRAGKKEYYQLQPDLYEAVLALDRDSSNILVKILALPARGLRAGAVLTPEFMLRNPMRDVFSAGLYAGSHPINFVKGLFHALKHDDLYWKWQASGGANATLVSMDRNYMQKSLRELMIKDWKKQLFSKVRHPIESLRDLSELTEQATRLGVFQKEAKSGKFTAEAIKKGAALSRDATIDFGRKGTKMTTPNRVIAFTNAAVQGLDKLARVHKNNPVAFPLKAMAYITLPTLALYLINRNNEKYKELPRWRRDFYWHIPVGEEQFIAIPKPFELGMIYGTLPERVFQYIDENDPQILNDMATSMWEASMPSVVPTAMLPWIEAYANKNMFTGAPLVPEGQENIEPYLQFGPRTTETAKLTSRAMAKIGLGVAPPVAENFVKGYSGGLGMRAVKGLDALFGLKKEDASIKTHPLEGIPGLSALAVPDPGAQSRWVTKFYSELEKADKAERSFKRLIDLGKPEEAQEYYEKHQKYIELAGPLRSVNAKVREMKNNLKLIDKFETDPMVKKQLLEQNYKIIAAVGRQIGGSK